MKRLSRMLAVAALATLVSAPALAREPGEGIRTEDAVVDAVVARPLGIVATVLGSAVFVVSLPFSALGGNVGEAADALVVGPAKETFARCLGCRSQRPSNVSR